MRIVIATGIYPPQVGGPALYAEGVKLSLEQSGHRAPLVLFGGLRSFPSGIRHVLYAIKLLLTARRSDAIFAFDTYSVGVPAAFVGRVLRIPVVLRIGGDFVWESYVERTEKRIPLPDFYTQFPKLSIKERIALRLVRSMLRHAELAFNTKWLLSIWQEAYRLNTERTHIVENVIGERLSGEESDRTLLLYGRPLALKNAPAFRRAFAKARKRGLDLSLEERVVSHEQLLERIRKAHAVAVPSVSDVAPNTVIDALRCGKPFLLTKYSGYAERFKEYGVIVDPLDEEDMARGMESLADEKTYRELCERIARFTENRGFDAVTDDFLRILQKRTERERGLSEGMRVLQIGSDRSKRGVLYPGSAGFKRQEAYAKRFGGLDIIGFSVRSDGARGEHAGPLHVYPTRSLSRFLYGFDALRIARRLPRPDVVSAQDPFETGVLGWLVARLKHAPLHVQVHTDFLSPEYVRHSLLNRLRVLVAGFVVRRAAHIRVVSEKIKTGIEARYRLRGDVSVLPIFVDGKAVRSASADVSLLSRFATYSSRLLVVSRLEPEKNVALALRSFAESAPSESCLIVVGDGNQRSALEQTAKDSGIADRVFFEGEKDAFPYYKTADLVLVPSLYEGYGLVTIEALMAGKPVLSTDVGVAREAGAVITSPDRFSGALANWFKEGPRTGELKNYPYADFDAYAQAYCDDILSCAGRQKK